MESKKVYIVGGYNESGDFCIWNYSSVCNRIEDAEKVLQQAITNSNGWVKNYKIFYVEPEHLKPINTNSCLDEYALLMDILPTPSMEWFNEDLSFETYIYTKWKYNKAKKAVTLEYHYDIPWYKLRDLNEGKRSETLDRLMYDIENHVKYIKVPQVKKILKERNMNIKVEFKNHYNGKKIYKGFITKE